MAKPLRLEYPNALPREVIDVKISMMMTEID